MRVLHVPYCYYPDAVGGTEIYVAALAREQRARGFNAAVAAPGGANRQYVHESCTVYRFAGQSTMKLDELYRDGDPESARNFDAVLDHFRPDMLHLHARSQAVSILLARAARRRGVPVVFTYHTPTVTCARGTMLLFGEGPCDGHMRATRCAQCMAHGKGMPKAAAMMAGALPSLVGRVAGATGLEGRLWTAIRSHRLMEIRHAAVMRMLREVDHICAVCEWVRDVLLGNGISRSKITLSRQGVPFPLRDSDDARRPMGHADEGDALRLAFLGRVDPSKGLDTAIGAMQRIPGRPVSLDVFAVAQNDAARADLEKLRQVSAGDSRIRFMPAVAAGDVVSTLRNYDALLVPSRWLETGPLVVYEAFAAGLPVLGSNLGGIAEIVDDGVSGMLIAPGSVEQWSRAIASLVDDPALLERLKAVPKPVRTAEDTARDAIEMYARVMRRRPLPTRAETVCA